MSPAKRAPESTEALRASLLDHARQIVARDGPSALTMRALAAEAGCATGLPYKVFADRHEIVLEIVHGELIRLKAVSDQLVVRAGSGSVGANLAGFAEEVLSSSAVALAQEVTSHDHLAKEFTRRVHSAGIGPSAIERAFAAYLVAERDAGRIDPTIDTDSVRVPPRRRRPQPGDSRRHLPKAHQTPATPVHALCRQRSRPTPVTHNPNRRMGTPVLVRGGAVTGGSVTTNRSDAINDALERLAGFAYLDARNLQRRRLIQSGQLRAVRLGRAIQVTGEALEEFLSHPDREP